MYTKTKCYRLYYKLSLT